jgi:hypothetical protein
MGRIAHGTQIAGAAGWWLRETSDKVIQPLLAEFPDPDPVDVAERMFRIQAFQTEIKAMKRRAFVLPVSAVSRKETPKRWGRNTSTRLTSAAATAAVKASDGNCSMSWRGCARRQGR